jgi:hypothetical protein
MKTINDEKLSLITVANFFLWHSILALPSNDYWVEEAPVFVGVYRTTVIVSVSVLNIMVVRRSMKKDNFSFIGYILFVLLLPFLSLILIGNAVLILRQGLY